MKHKIFGAEKDLDSFNGIRRMPLHDPNNVIMEIIMDEFSIEFFVNGLSASFQVYNDFDADGVCLNINALDCEYIKSPFR